MRRVAVLESGTGIGGAEINIIQIDGHLKNYGWDMLVLVPGPGLLTTELEHHHIAWRQYPALNFHSTSFYLGHHKVLDPFAILYDSFLIGWHARAIARILRQEQVTVLHTNSILSHLSGGLAARWSGVPCVWHMQDIVDPHSGLGLFRPLLRWLARRVPKSVVCISRAVAEQFGASETASWIRVIYNGVDTDVFTPDGPAPYQSQWRAGGFDFVVGQIGRVTPWKGQAIVIAVAECARNEGFPIRFVIIGDDGYGLPGYLSRLKSMVNAQGLEVYVTFSGWLANVPDALRSLDLLVHPTLEPEPFGLAVAEAMACGRPVIVSDHGGAQEVVGPPECGTRVPPGDVQAFWRAIRQAFFDRTAARLQGARARERVQLNFGLESFVEQMANVYASAAES